MFANDHEMVNIPNKPTHVKRNYLLVDLDFLLLNSYLPIFDWAWSLEFLFRFEFLRLVFIDHLCDVLSESQISRFFGLKFAFSKFKRSSSCFFFQKSFQFDSLLFSFLSSILFSSSIDVDFITLNMGKLM